MPPGTVNDSTGILPLIGTQLLGRFYLLIPLSLLEGVFLLLFVASTASVCKRGLKTWASRLIFVGTVLNFGLGTTQWAGLVAGAILETRILLVEHPDLSFEQRISIYEGVIMTLQTPLAIMEAIPIIIGDAIIMWRAWSLFPDQRWAMVLPSTLLLGSFGTWIAVASRANSPNVPLTINGFLAYLSLSLASNIVTTLLIAWKLWKYRQFLSSSLGLNPQKSPVLRVLVTIVESGGIFAILQFGFLILQTPAVLKATTKKSEENAENVLNVAFLMLSAFYPSLVVLLVNTQNSYLATVDLGSDGSHRCSHKDRPLTSISFAEPSLSLRSTKSQSSATSWTRKASNPPSADLTAEGYTLEIMDGDMDVFKNPGITRHTASAP